ncbi:MAG: polysaccharide biosynthesis C-terminal domain-containing protein, partial [Planctomycetales bacterium]|nr:polysaccharide biosynthesis C-terminal domain-containing protein [Planctomycetales bacterium]
GAYVLFNDHGVITLAWVIAISRLVTFLTINLLLGFSLRQDNIPAARVSVGVCRKLLSSSMVFLGSDGINALWHSMDAMILSTYATEADIGLLQSSFQLLQPALMVYRSVGHSSFPALVEAARVGPEKIAEISNSLIGYLLRLSIPAAIAMFVLSEDLLVTVYGNEEFRAGGIVLKILSVTLILDLINPVLGHGLWAASRDKSVLKIVICNLVVSCLVAFFLIRSFGLVGAACSVLTSTVVNVIQHNWYFQREVVRMPLWKEALKVVPAASVLVVCVALLPTHRFVSLGIGIVAYVVINLLRFPESWRRASQPNAVAS